MQPGTIGTDPGRRSEPLQILDDRRHGDVVAFGHTRVTGQRPPRRQRLRRRQCRIKPRHRTHHSPRCRRPIAQRVAPRRPGNRITARQQPLECFGCHVTRQPQPGSLCAGPQAGCLARRLGQVARVVPRRRRGRPGIERRDPHHEDSLLPAGTCLSIISRVVRVVMVGGASGLDRECELGGAARCGGAGCAFARACGSGSRIADGGGR